MFLRISLYGERNSEWLVFIVYFELKISKFEFRQIDMENPCMRKINQIIFKFPAFYIDIVNNFRLLFF